MEKIENILAPVNSGHLPFGAKLRHLLGLALGKLAYRAYLLAKEREEISSAISRLRDDLKNERDVRSGYTDHYTEEAEVGVLNRYRELFRTATPEKDEVLFRAFHVRDQVIQLIEKDPSIRNVVNFGCSYGWLEHELASRFPSVRVWGIDRSEKAMRQNEKEFAMPNISYVAIDMFEFIKGRPEALESAVFCHLNIGVYFLPAFISKLYRAIHAAGARYVVAFEPSGMSRQTNDYYRYTLEPKLSVVFRGVMLLNNYPALLKEAGFGVTSSALLSPPHPHPDFRSASFVAKRAELPR